PASRSASTSSGCRRTSWFTVHAVTTGFLAALRRATAAASPAAFADFVAWSRTAVNSASDAAYRPSRSAPSRALKRLVAFRGTRRRRRCCRDRRGHRAVSTGRDVGGRPGATERAAQRLGDVAQPLVRLAQVLLDAGVGRRRAPRALEAADRGDELVAPHQRVAERRQDLPLRCAEGQRAPERPDRLAVSLA